MPPEKVRRVLSDTAGRGGGGGGVFLSELISYHDAAAPFSTQRHSVQISMSNNNKNTNKNKNNKKKHIYTITREMWVTAAAQTEREDALFGTSDCCSASVCTVCPNSETRRHYF